MNEREKLSIIFWYCSRKEVAVKIQYPDIADLVDADLTVLERIFTTLANIAPGMQLQPVLDYLRGGLPMLQLLQRLRLPSVVALEIVAVLLSAYFFRLSGVWLYMMMMGFLFVGGAVCLAYSVRNETYKSFGWGLTLGDRCLPAQQ